MSSKFYIHESTQKIYNLHKTAIEQINEKTTVLAQLTAFANILFEAWTTRNPVCKGQINNWHPSFISQSLDVIFKAGFRLADARLSIAKDCGFYNWEAVEKQGNIPFNLAFEKAVDTLLAGDLASLKTQIKEQPDLLQLRSTYGHQATLLHYAGSNGVEMWRQQTPYNLPAIVQFLLDAGADKNAKMNIYGGYFTTWDMVATSAHPQAAGVVVALKKILVD